MQKKSLLIFIFCTLTSFTFSQKIDSLKLDSILNKPIDDVEVEDIVVVYRDEASYQKLRRDVLKAYPYALRAASIINQIEENTKSIKKKKHKKRYLKKKEKVLKNQFEKNLRNLTKTQGRYMVRLINRETGNTVYNLIREYKNGMNAVLWQIIAKKFDSDLKSVYQPKNTNHIDYEIESIVTDLSPTYREMFLNEIKIDPPTYRDFQ